MPAPKLEIEIRAARRERDWAREQHRRAQEYITTLEARLASANGHVAQLIVALKHTRAELETARRRLPWH